MLLKHGADPTKLDDKCCSPSQGRFDFSLKIILTKSLLFSFKGSPHEIDQILMMTHILSSDSIRRPLFSTHPTDPEFKSENCLDPHEDYP